MLSIEDEEKILHVGLFEVIRAKNQEIKELQAKVLELRCLLATEGSRLRVKRLRGEATNEAS